MNNERILNRPIGRYDTPNCSPRGALHHNAICFRRYFEHISSPYNLYLIHLGTCMVHQEVAWSGNLRVVGGWGNLFGA